MHAPYALHRASLTREAVKPSVCESVLALGTCISTAHKFVGKHLAVEDQETEGAGMQSDLQGISNSSSVLSRDENSQAPPVLLPGLLFSWRSTCP